MMLSCSLLLGAFVLTPGLVLAGDLTPARNEKNPEKSYWLALENANSVLGEARKSLSEGQLEALRKNLDETVESVQFARDKLYSTGKSPSRNSRHFKRAELKLRDLLKKLDGLLQEAGFEDRQPIEAAKKKVQQLHDDLLFDIMGRRKQ
ncbi:MAG: DUF2524 family protein [Bryobacterales bacterium]|nr:DUF2524 family protein [Bryobacterales bacterium]